MAEHLVRIRTDQPFVGCKPQPDRIKDIDWHNSSDRKWLMSHLHWAMMNGRTTILYPSPTGASRTIETLEPNRRESR